MSSAIGLSSPTRNQASIPLTQSAYSGVQDFSKFDSAELSGYVEAEGSSSFRASVKLSIVKNGAGTYEVAASDIAGDDVSGAPLVSFQMTGSLLEAKIDDGVASFSSAVIKFALISPPNSAGSLSIDASSVVSGTIDSGVLPAASALNSGIITTSAQSFSGVKTFEGGIEIGTQTNGDLYSGIYTPSFSASSGLTGGSFTLRKAYYIRIGDIVQVNVQFDISGTNTAGVCEITLPISSNLSGTFDLHGVSTQFDGSGGSVVTNRVRANSTLDTARVTVNSPASSGRSYHTQFTYQII